MLHKLLLTVTVVLVVWVIIRLVQQKRRGRRSPRSWTGGGGPVQDMVRCPVCGDFRVPGNRSPCGREECPYS